MLDQLLPNEHWNRFYRAGTIPSIPSQFCVFVANEFPDVPNVIEAGCGNGRDASYFAQVGRNVVGFDASGSAIATCQERTNGESATFLRGSADDNATWDLVREALRATPGPVIVYARFFLHAIDENIEAGFLRQVAALLAERGGHFCVEFRTNRDMDHTKVTPDHYRRFIEPLSLAARLGSIGMTIEYFAEGYGMAKYQADDAYVARVIARSNA